MKGLFIFILIALLVVLLLFTHKSKETGDKTYPQKMADALDQAGTLFLDSKISDIKTALNSYYTDNNRYPDTLDLLVPTYLRLEDQLLDPWGTKFKIETDSDSNVTLISAGKNKIFGDDDDIKRRLL